MSDPITVSDFFKDHPIVCKMCGGPYSEWQLAGHGPLSFCGPCTDTFIDALLKPPSSVGPEYGITYRQASE